MSYKPLTAKQAEEMMRPPLIEDGRYQFEVVEVHRSDKYHNPLVDSKGAPMTKLRLKIWDNNAHERFLFTNLFWGEENRMSYRTRHFAESIGMLEQYESGELLARIATTICRTGMCEVYTQKGKDKNDGSGEKWQDKNEVKDFFIADGQQSISVNEKVKDEFNDEIPF